MKTEASTTTYANLNQVAAGRKLSSTKHWGSFYMQLVRGFLELLVSPSRFVWVVFDFALISLLYVFFSWFSPKEVWGETNLYIATASLTYSGIFIVSALGLGFYDVVNRFRFRFVIGTAFISASIAFTLTLAFNYFLFYKVFGRFNIFYGTAGTLVVLLIVRGLLSYVISVNPLKFTVLGTSPSMREIVEFFSDSKAPKFYMFVPWQDDQGDLDEETRLDAMVRSGVANIVVSRGALDESMHVDLAIHGLKRGCKITDEITFYAETFEKLPIVDATKEWLLRESIQTHRFLTDLSKRIFDIVMALTILIVMAPVLLILALSIKVHDGGPVFYRQKRLGKYFIPFTILKFRTMKCGSDASDGFTKHADERVTKIGKLIRPLHLDELPQLWNILKGEMSIVGARPEYIDFAEKISKEIPLYGLRYLMAPGVTGWAQVNQGYAMDTIEDTKTKLAYDLYYLSRHSFWLDIRILIRTVFALTKRAR